MIEITRDDLTIVNFSNNTVVVGNKKNSDFIDYILDICQINNCQIINTRLTNNTEINKSKCPQKQIKK
jgi:hypothetical protein